MDGGRAPERLRPGLLRGYTMGEYLGENMSSLEVEERYRIAARWTATFFAGGACLYGAGKTCDDPTTSTRAWVPAFNTC